MVAISILVAMGIKLLRMIGPSELKASAITTLANFALCVFLAIRFRRALRTNSFHRGTVVYGLVIFAQALTLRGLGVLLNFTYLQLVTPDLVAISATSCMAALFMPSVWPLVPLNWLSAVTVALFPAHAQIIASVTMYFSRSPTRRVKYPARVQTRHFKAAVGDSQRLGLGTVTAWSGFIGSSGQAALAVPSLRHVDG